MVSAKLLHEKAITMVKKYLASENELLEIIQEIFDTKAFRELGYRSLHEYCVIALKLTDAQAYAFTSILKKNQEVPMLKEAIQKGELSLNTARKIVSVITPETQKDWIEKAKTLRQKELEKEIVKTHPEKGVRSRIKPITETKRELRCLIDKDLESMMERIQDLESQRTKKPVTLEEALMAMAKLFLEKKDPIEKAKRCHEREKVKVTTPAKEIKLQFAKLSARRKIPTPILRQVHLRDRGQCQAPNCQEKRWLQVHHIKPWAHGGGHELNNLLTLCFFHHRRVHLSPSKGELGLRSAFSN
jgi:hypothetical protein